MHVSRGEIAEEVSISLCVVAVYLACYIGQYPKVRQPIGMHVSPGEIAEEVSVGRCRLHTTL
jgi:hypothetical protein